MLHLPGLLTSVKEQEILVCFLVSVLPSCAEMLELYFCNK